jgi:FMN phosphatase YigB (HAD superfamily)
VIDSGSIILFDFDGTVATGAGPVLAYARAVAATLPAPAGVALVAAAEAGLHGTPSLDGVLPLDGYDLVRILAARQGVSEATLESSYLRSRALLGGADAPVVAPDGLAEHLETLRGDAVVILATNAPDIRLRDALGSLGLLDSFDEVVASAGKPGALPALLDRLESRHPGTTRVLSVGDVWANDLEPVHARGHATALVGAVPPGADPTFHAPELPSLYPAIASWARAARPVRSARPHPAPPLTIEGSR